VDNTSSNGAIRREEKRAEMEGKKESSVAQCGCKQPVGNRSLHLHSPGGKCRYGRRKGRIGGRVAVGRGKGENADCTAAVT